MDQKTRSLGTTGEAIARKYLERKGYVFLTNNWLCKLGEIDLIMQEGNTRVIIEVRLRSSSTYGEGLDTVGRQKQAKLIRTAQAYQQKENYWGDVRFDVVSITLHHKKALVKHIPDAFSVM